MAYGIGGDRLLNSLKRAERQIGRAPREDLPPAARWLRDNARALFSLAAGQDRALKRREYRRLQGICADLAAQAAGPMRENALCRAVMRAQAGQPMSVRELRALPAMLRRELLRRLTKILPAVLDEYRQWQEGARLHADAAHPIAAHRAIETLRQAGRMEEARTMEGRLRAAGADPRETAAQARAALAATAAEMEAVIPALLSLEQLDGGRVAEKCSDAAARLRAAAIWRRMDREGRALYLTGVSRLSRALRVEEAEICKTALALCEGKTGAQGDPGYYLLEDTRALRSALGKRPGLSARGRVRLYAAYLAGMAGAFWIVSLLLLPWYGALPLAFACTDLSRRLAHRFAARWLPRRLLPRIKPACFPAGTRALVAVPVALSGREQAISMCRQLSVLYWANPDAPADFLLLCDFPEAEAETMPEDEATVHAAAAGVEALRQAHGPRFFCMLRGRSYEARDGRWAGRERKRGALAMLNALLAGESPADPILFSTAEPSFFARRYTHVITLDADTFLPAGAPEKLLGAMLHPLQAGRVAVIQPRMLTLPMHVHTHAQRLLAGRGGADGYGAAAADFYQDAFGRGSFMGKGIYAPEAFRAATAKLPEGRILSHDLIEGELAGAALASDIVCYDGHPWRVCGFLRRAHRWTRGDWQIAGFLGSRTLDLLSKLKIWDNLRRSLTPFLRMLALIVSSLHGAYWPFLLALLPASPGEILRLPAQALNRLDAALRALWRQGVSHRKLLEWVTAAQGDENDLRALARALPPMLSGIALLFSAAATAFWPGFALGACWLAGPLITRWLDRPIRRREALDARQRRFLREAARDTLAWFETQVNEKTRFLPPDNEQIDPARGPALRVSPTNIGLYLLALCAAKELGFIDGPGLISRVEKALDTVERLPLWHGIPYNWYSLETLEALPPRTVSSVDAGNYLICLMAAAQAVRETRLPGNAAARLDALCERMALQRLYDRRARLFYVSIESDTGRPSAGHYDLLASEAQLLSFAAIVCGRVPESHWWRLGRPWMGGRRGALLSWSGTMFEYMMGALLLPAWPDTLLAAARRGCAAAQRRAGRDGLFGISESGYARFDADLNYRYRAFGAAELAIDPDSAGAVYAPYAAALALPAAPGAACDSLRRMKEMGAYDGGGFYEAIDYTRGAPRLVYSHMAHHQGMLLCALCNALCGDALPGLLLRLPRVEAHLPLLNELPPRRGTRLPRPLTARRDMPEEGPLRIQADPALPADALLVSGGGTSLLLNARGHGRLFRGAVSWTRFDERRDALSGPQIYLAEAGRAPIRLTGGTYTWLDGAARCALSADGLRGEATVCVEPLTGAAVWRARVRNMDRKAREPAVIFYLTPALENQRDDAAHTAFSDLFLTVAPEGDSGCLLRRRMREGGERLLHARAYAEACDRLDDRALFFGREGSAEAPLGLLDDWRLTGGSEPCLALRVRMQLAPGEERTLCFALGPTLPDNDAALNAESLAAARARVQRRVLGIDARQAALAARIAGALLYAGDAFAPARRTDLWALGISGDAPLLTVELSDAENTAALGQIARLFGFLIENGADAELIVLLPAEPGYEQPLRVFCEGLNAPRLRILNGLDEKSKAVLRAHSALYLTADAPLEGQLPQRPAAPPPAAAAPGGTLPTLPRLYAWNGYGGFTPDFGYAVCRAAPAPWCHILCNERFGTLVSEQGILYSYAGNSRLRRLTRVCQDGVLTEPSETYLITENGESWSLTRRPLGNVESRALYEMGAATYQCALPGLSAALTCFAHGEWSCGGRAVTLRNTSGTARRLTLEAGVRFALGETGRGTHAEAKEGLLTARGDMDGVGFFALRGSRAGADGAAGTLRREISLRPGEAATLTCWLGWCEREEDIAPLLARLSPEAARDARAGWRERLDALQCYLPERLLSGWLGGFLPYQIWAARLMMRGGFWQSGGAWGFRDQLQDLLPLLYTAPDFARAHLLRCAARQYAEGDVQHWWHPGGAGVRTRISDDRLFLPWVTARYVQVTGDREVLEEAVSFLISPPLREDERDRYEAPEQGGAAPLREHCLRAVDSLRYGERGIPLMEGGDWNDGMNEVGGESVWLGFFLLMVLRDFAPLCSKDVQDDFDRRRIALHTALQSAWTGRWFLRAWYRDGKSLGAPDSPVPRIDLISQCFAAFAGMPRDQVTKALDAAWNALHREEAGITLLLTPPFAPEEKAGYIGAYNPGVRENGGQYTHALPWFMRALLMNGRTERAWQLLDECLPWHHSDTPEKARRYRVEPYVLAGDVHADGRGGWTWYTGSAAWLYEVTLRDFLGFDKKGDTVRLAPRVPRDWEEITLVYRFGRSRWQLTAARDAHYITLDGEKITGAYAPLRDDGRAHEIRFPLAER